MAKTILEEIAALRQGAAKQSDKIDQIELLARHYPDLRRHTGRWGKEVYCSATVNAQADKYDLRHNCGCCHDSPLELWPYFTHPEGGRVYSDPPVFQIGERCEFGDRPYIGWESKLRVASIPESVITAMEAHFTMREDEEEEDGDTKEGE